MAKQRIVSVTTFKAQCLGLIDRVAQSGEELVVTKHKRAVVRVVPAAAPTSLRGSVRYLVSDEELIAPLDERWAALE